MSTMQLHTHQDVQCVQRICVESVLLLCRGAITATSTDTLTNVQFGSTAQVSLWLQHACCHGVWLQAVCTVHMAWIAANGYLLPCCSMQVTCICSCA